MENPSSSSSTSQTATFNNEAALDASAVCCQDLWFSDGNIVLATKTMLFRVHKSILARHSSVFRDMFELVAPAQHGRLEGEAAARDDVYEILPVISLPSDEGLDMEELLLAVYDRFFYHNDNKDNYHLNTTLALLHLSTKYDFEGIQSEVITHIAKVYPTHLDEFEAIDDDGQVIFLKNRRDVHLPLLHAVVSAGIDDLFPSLYYACAAHHSLPEILTAFSSTNSPGLHRLLVGRERLSNAIHVMMGVYVEETEHCLLRHKADEPNPTLAGVCIADAFATHSLRAVSGKVLRLDWDLADRVCNICYEPMLRRIDEERVRVWQEMPGFFELERWDVVRRKIDCDNSQHVRKSARKVG